MTRNFLLFIFVFSLIIANSKLTAQVDAPLVPLQQILESISEYDVSYVDKEVSAVRCIAPPKNLAINDLITFLDKNTPFTCITIADKTIALQLKKNSIAYCGVISDIQGKPLSNAIIYGKNYTISANENGVFTLYSNSKKGKLSIHHLGYEPRYISIQKLIEQPCKQIVLYPKITTLKTVTLSDYLIKGIYKEKNGSFRIDYNNFGILPGLIEPDLLQTVQALPGIVSVAERISDINVRGGTHDQNLFLWDGIKIYQTSHFFGLISAFNPYLTKSVNLFKNGTHASYSDGVSSVISLNTNNELNHQFKAGIGSNMISYDGYIDTPIGTKSSLQFAARHSINEFINTPTYQRFFDKAFQDTEVINDANSDEAFSFFDTSTRFLHQWNPKNKLKVNSIWMHNELTFLENQMIDAVNISRKSSAEQTQIAGGIQYEHIWHKNFRSNLQWHGTSYRLETLNADIQNNQRLVQENQVLESGVRLDNQISLTKQLNLQAGYHFNETGITNLRDVNNPTFRERIKEVVRTHSLYTSTQWESTNQKTNANIGGRLSYFEKFNAYRLEPRLQISHQFSDAFTIETLGELKNQTTSQIIDLQSDFLGIENRRWVLSNNENIPILKSKQLSLGIRFSKKNWLINAEAYLKEVDGIITKSQGFQNQFEFRDDHGRYLVKGIDFLINKKWNRYRVWFSYSYADNEYRFNNLIPEAFPNNIDIRHNANIAMAYSSKNIKLSTGIHWHSGRPITTVNSETPIIANEINFETPNGNRLEDYLRWDMSGTYNFAISANTKAHIGISLWNLLAKTNLTNTYYKLSPDNNRIQQVPIHGLKTTPNMVFRLQFH